MAGSVSRLSRWTPIERPIRNAISIIHLSEYFSSATSSHLSIAQNTAAVKNDDVAYTSPSTAENQNESEKVKASAPVAPAAIIAAILAVLNMLSSLTSIFLAR